MILYASQRGRSAELAHHLLNGDENDHVTVHDIRGFVSDDLTEALREAYAMSRGTRCRQFLFSLSLNPPEYANVPIEEFEAAIEEIEKRLSLVDQPRIIVFHEKNGRRHCHCIWSRIDADKLVAVRMSHFKRKLMEVSRLLYLKHGWKMPKGMERGEPRSPLQLTREEYRQAVRLSEDPQALKAMFKAAWEQSDSKTTFIRALEERGLLLARGDRRGYVAIDVKGGVYSLTRWLDIGTRDLKARLGAPETLPDITQAKAFLASRMTENLNRFIADAKRQVKDIRLPLVQEIRSLALDQRQERKTLIATQQKRWVHETRQRTARLHTGVAGVWQRVTGAYQKIRLINEIEARAGLERDRKELHALIRLHLEERQDLQKTVLFYRTEHRIEVFRLRQEIAHYVSTATEPFLPQSAAKAQNVGRPEKMPLAVHLEQVETKIALLSGDLSMLQASLESNLLSDEMRVMIRRMIERTLETLHIKAVEEKVQKEQVREKTREYELKQGEFNEYIRRYAEIQLKLEQENRKTEANKQFYAVVMHMGYALNGVPRWQISVMSPPPEKRLDEKAFTATLRRQDNRELIKTVFVSRPRSVNPPSAAPDLRVSVLEVKEVLRRAGLQPSGGGLPRMTPAVIKLNADTTTKASIKFNTQRK